MRLQKYLASCGIASRRKCEAYILEGQRDDLLDILEENNVYRAIEDLGSFCPDEKIVGTYECVGLHDGFSCFCCEQCWKNILGI